MLNPGMLKRPLLLWLCTVLAVSVATPARVLCRGAGGHVEVEWAFASCCGTPVVSLFSLEASFGEPPPSGCGDCVDTLLPSMGPVVQASWVARVAPPSDCAVFRLTDRLHPGFEPSSAPHSDTGPPLYLSHHSLLI